MKVGFFSVGTGPAAYAEVIASTARTVEDCGYHSLWALEHVVLVDRYTSRYPYSTDGITPFPSTADILDPFLALTYAAAHTRTVRLATGICLVPERNPVVTAKEVASLDRLSGGRFTFGVGIGWLEEEFAAVGVPWERRAARTREYLAAMKRLWTEEEPDFAGEFVSFPKVRLYPKPEQKPYPPILFGGESGPALRRVAEVGDGWFGAYVSPETARQKIERIRELAGGAGRDASRFHFAVSPGLGVPIDLALVERYRDAGADEVVLGSWATTADDIRADVERLAEKIVAPAAKL